MSRGELARDDRRAQRQQEDEDDDHGEEEAEQALLRERFDRLLDERRLVEDDRELRVGERLFERVERGDDPLRHLDGVRRRQLGDRDRQGVLAVDARDRADGLCAEFDGRNIGDRRRRTCDIRA